TFGQSITLTANISGLFSGVATGTVTFSNGTSSLGSASVSGNTATFVTTTLPVGTDSITAAYSGDSNFTGSSSSTLSQVVSAQVGATGEWTWMGGSKTVDHGGIYGTVGTPAAGNIPGSRQRAVSWTDGSGNLWLFGG